jgi:O-antigen/teichoic acid export membrane protein
MQAGHRPVRHGEPFVSEILKDQPPAEDRSLSDHDARHAARSGAVQVLTILAQGLLAATQVVFARLYGKPIYGSYLSALAVLEVLYRGGTGGADKAMLRYVAAARASNDPAGVRSAIGTGLRLNLLVAGVFGVGLVIAAPWIAAAVGERGLTPALRVLAPLPLLIGALWILIQASLAARTTRANFWVRGLAEPSLLLAGGVVAWTLGAGLLGLTAAHLLAAAATLILAIVVVRRVLRPEETAGVLRAPALPGFAAFSLPIAGSEMLNAVLQRADILILTTLRGVEAAALFGAGELMTRAIANIRYAFDSIVAGVLSETLQLGDLERLKYNLRLATRWVVSVAAPIAVTIVVLRKELLGVLFGSAYLSAATAVIALAASHFVNAALGLTGWVLVVAGSSRLVLLNNLISAAFNVPMAYLLIRHFGVAGAGVAALATTLLLQALILGEVAALKRVHPLSLALVKPLVAAAIAVGVEVAVRAALPAVWGRSAVVIAGGALAYGVALIALGLPPEERQLFDRIVKRRRR